jgi:hypothetical protein
MRRMVRALPPFMLLLAGLASAGCGPLVDLTKGLQVIDVSTGWNDDGVVDGKNKLVPSVAFRLRNVSDQPLRVLQVNAVFRRVNDPNEWGAVFLAVPQSGPLQPGATTPLLTIKSRLGYTGEDPRSDMLKNSQFVDARVEIYAKYASAQWARISQYPIDRHLNAQ